MKSFYQRPAVGAYVIPGLFLLPAVCQLLIWATGSQRASQPLQWNAETIGLLFVLPILTLFTWPRPYAVTITEAGIMRRHGIGFFWGDHSGRRFSLAWNERRQWQFRHEPVSDGESTGTIEIVELEDGAGNRFGLAGCATAIRDELRLRAPGKESAD